MEAKPPALPPVQLPDDLAEPERPKEDREVLRARLRERTQQLSSKRQRHAPKAHAQISEAASSLGLSSQAASAHALLNSMRAEDVADLIRSTMRSGQVPEQFRGLIPPEARNLGRKEMIRLIEQLQSK